MITRILILLEFLLCFFVHAQPNGPDVTLDHTPSVFWLNGGAGFGLLGFTYDGGAYYQNEKTIVGLRYLRTDQISLELWSEQDIGIPRPLESVWEIDAFVGKKFFDRGFTISLITGINISGGIQRGNLIKLHGWDNTNDTYSSYDEYQHLTRIALGLPIEVRLAYTPWQYYDLGISYIININSRKSLTGFLVSFRILLPVISVAA